MQSITDPENVTCEVAPFELSEFRKPALDTEIREAAFANVTDLNRLIRLHFNGKDKHKIILLKCRQEAA